MNFFKMLDFQRIRFFQKKRLWKRAISLLNQIVKISLLSQIIRFQINAPFGDFLTVITKFFGSLKLKGRWLFKNNKLSLKIFWLQALWKPCFENKRNFWINCVCIKAFVSWYTHKGAFAFIAYLKGHLHHCIPTRLHSHHCMHHKGASTSWHTYMNIYIMTYPQRGIYIMAYLHEHLHHDMPIRKHLHHKTFCIFIPVRRRLHHK